MKSTLGKVAVAAAILGTTGAASALTVSGDAGVARSFKTFDYKQKGMDKVGIKSFDYNLSVAAQPMNEYPVSLGVNASLITFNKDDISNVYGATKKADTAFGYEFSPEIKIWAPAELLGSVGDILVPYVKASYTFDALSSYTVEYKDAQGEKLKFTGKTQGFHIGLGTSVTVTENISALVDYSYSDTYYQNKFEGEKGDKDYLTSHSFMIGARISV